MASLLFREMKGASFSCTSPASATTCASIDRRSVVRPSSAGRTIDRHTPHLRDSWRANSSLRHLSRPPTTPKPYNQKSRSTDKQISDMISLSGSSRHRRSVEKQPDHQLISPANSSRYLLDDNAFFDIVTAADPKPVRALPPIEASPRLQPLEIYKYDSAIMRPPPSTATNEDQVVVLRVSLHCKGCEGKVRRHIAKMEGVTSFNIDMAMKRVTVIGKVTPLGVLNSVSKVKNAEFWSAPPRSSVSF